MLPLFRVADRPVLVVLPLVLAELPPPRTEVHVQRPDLGLSGEPHLPPVTLVRLPAGAVESAPPLWLPERRGMCVPVPVTAV